MGGLATSHRVGVGGTAAALDSQGRVQELLAWLWHLRVVWT